MHFLGASGLKNSQTRANDSCLNRVHSAQPNFPGGMHCVSLVTQGISMKVYGFKSNIRKDYSNYMQCVFEI